MSTPHELQIAASVLRALEEVAGLVGRFTSSQSPVDGRVRLERGDTAVDFSTELKHTLRRGHLPSVLESMRRLPQPAILLTHHVTEPLAQELAKHNVNFADAAGNAHIAHGDWFIFTTGRSAPATGTPSTLTASTWKVAFALLRDPHLGQTTVRELAAHAGVSPGATTKAIQALDARGWVSNHGRQRLLVQPRALWRAWEGGWVDRLAAKLFVTRATAPSHHSLVEWSELAGEVDDILVGGELAAHRLKMGIVATSGTLHIRRWDAATMGRLRMVPDTNGAITVRRRFGDLDEHPEHPGLAHPLLVRAELLTTIDERLDDIRQMLAARIENGLSDAP